MKRKLWIALALALLLALCCGAAANAERIVDEGICGQYLTWTLTDTGLLTISGTGPMYTYFYDPPISTAPWRGKAIKRVVIDDGVTSIGDFAFYRRSSLTSVTIPDSVTSIGSSAFSGCSSLTSIKIPSSVTSIGFGAFSGCSSLTSITIPSGVTSIGGGAFGGCSSLTSITIPEGVTSIGGSAFRGCSSLTSITIPASVTSIGSDAFLSCSSLMSISIPVSVACIGEYAFCDCSSLKNITISAGVISIGDYTFSGCSNLTCINVDSSNPTYSSDNGVLFNKDLTTIIKCPPGFIGNYTIPDSVRSINEDAFSGCGNLTGITIPEGITSIDNRLFKGCGSLTSVTIPSSVKSINEYTFDSCDRLQYVEILGYRTTFEPYVLGKNRNCNPIVYCYEYSDTDFWAEENGLTRIYLGSAEASESRVITMPEVYRLPCGETATITPVIIPSTDDPMIIWESSAPEIVSVKNGVLTANALGTAVITANAGKASAAMEVTSFIKAESFDIPAEIWVESKGTAKIECTNIRPENAMLFLEFSSADTNTAEVDQDGGIKGKKLGDTTITAKDTQTGIMRETTVHVCYPAQTVTLNKKKAETYIGGTVQLKATVKTQRGTFENTMVQFISSDESIATVDSKGLVTGVNNGSAIITAQGVGEQKPQ